MRQRLQQRSRLPSFGHPANAISNGGDHRLTIGTLLVCQVKATGKPYTLNEGAFAWICPTAAGTSSRHLFTLNAFVRVAAFLHGLVLLFLPLLITNPSSWVSACLRQSELPDCLAFKCCCCRCQCYYYLQVLMFFDFDFPHLAESFSWLRPYSLFHLLRQCWRPVLCCAVYLQRNLNE